MKRILFVTLMLSSAFAFADTKADLAKIDTDFNICLSGPDASSNSGMKGCTATAYRAADVVLNTVYKSLVTTLKGKTGNSDEDKNNAEVLSRLIAAERAWITFRNTNSDLYGVDMLGGSEESLEIAMQAYTMTASRAQELENIFSR